jgi:gas vesicle structural protein
MSSGELVPADPSITLVELVDRLLDKGVVVSGEVTIAVADVDLIQLGLRVLLSSVETIEKQR